MIFAYILSFMMCLLFIIGISAMGVSILFEHSELTVEYQPKKQDRTEVKPIIIEGFFEDDDLLLADDILE